MSDTGSISAVTPEGNHLLFSAVSIILLLVIFLKQKTWLYALCLVFPVCMSVFAQKYTPMIDQNAEIISPETESILYLENHLKGGERILSRHDAR